MSSGQNKSKESGKQTAKETRKSKAATGQSDEKSEVGNDLFDALLSLKNRDDFARFFEDLCTPAEITSLIDRWLVARLVADGVSYRSIQDQTGVSTATVTRVARALTYGAGGYEIALKRTKKRSRGDA